LLGWINAVALAALVAPFGVDAMNKYAVGNVSSKPFIDSSNRINKPLRLFISGHSLTDQPLPNQMEAIASSLGTPLEWNRHYIVGSSIATRSRGRDLNDQTWSGYRDGFNRSEGRLDVASELRNPKTVTGGIYDVLIITEQNGLLDSLTFNDTVRYLRHYHDLFIQGNSQGKTYFFEPWIGLNDKSNPRRWIDFERAASPIWQCIATRINISLNAEGRRDRVYSLPAGAALADLIETATSARGLPSITLGNIGETVGSIVKDDVHLTELGSYFVALVSHSFTHGRSPYGAWHPKNVSEIQAKALQQKAWDFYSNYLTTNAPLTLDECQKKLRVSFISVYWTYVRDVFWPLERNSVSAYFRWLRYLLKWHWQIRHQSRDNPFHFDPVTDKTYWFPGP